MVSGSDILDDVEEFIARFVALPSEDALVALTLWAAHAHRMDAWESTPRAAMLSPEPGSGKTRVLETLELLVPRPLLAVNASSAALFRAVSDSKGAPTILFDEIDTVFGPKAKENEDIRGLLNAGHRRGATALRCAIHGKDISVEEFPAYAAVALAGLGDLPDTLMSRSIVIRMRRRAPHERVEPFRRRLHEADGHKVRGALASWLASADLQWPDMPGGVEDRDADCWEPLLAVADAAGGDWPERGRVAAVTLVTATRQREGSLGVRLLTDLREVIGADETVHTEDILRRLHNLDESPWADLRGKPLDARRLARLLNPYGIAPKLIRQGSFVARGYVIADLADPFQRYLSQPPKERVTAVTPVTEAPALFDPTEPRTAATA